MTDKFYLTNIFCFSEFDIPLKMFTRFFTGHFNILF
jgi:hypothetical protein